MRIFGLNILTDYQVEKISCKGWLQCKEFTNSVTSHQMSLLRNVIKPQKKYEKLYYEAINFIGMILKNRIDIKY